MVLSDTIQLVRLLQIKVGCQALYTQHVANCGHSDAPHHMLLQNLCCTFNSYLLHLPASARQLNLGFHGQHPMALGYTGSEQITTVQKYICRALSCQCTLTGGGG